MLPLEQESKPTKFAFLGVGQAVPPNEIVQFANLLLETNPRSLRYELVKAQMIANDIYNGTQKFNLRDDLFDLNSPSFLRTDFIQPETLELCAEALDNVKLKHCEALIPDYLAGHSLGAVFAAFVSGAIPDRMSLREIGVYRGKVMQEAYEKTPSTLLSIQGLTEEAVLNMLPTYAKIGLINAPTLIAVGLPEGKVEELQEYAVQAGARRATPLRTRGAFHVGLYMEKAAEKMQQFLKVYDFEDVKTGVFVANSDGRIFTKGQDIKEELIKSMTVPVRYPDMLKTMSDVDIFIEIGPGNILSSLNALNGIPKGQTKHISHYL